MRARALLVGLYVGVAALAAPALLSSAWAQSSTDANPIGKVLTAAGSIHIEHPAAILAQANLPTDAGQAKVGDLVYRGDMIQTGPDGKLGVAFADGSSFT